VFISQKGARG
jgi:hypothetical protein